MEKEGAEQCFYFDDKDQQLDQEMDFLADSTIVERILRSFATEPAAAVSDDSGRQQAAVLPPIKSAPNESTVMAATEFPVMSLPGDFQASEHLELDLKGSWQQDLGKICNLDESTKALRAEADFNPPANTHSLKRTRDSGMVQFKSEPKVKRETPCLDELNLESKLSTVGLNAELPFGAIEDFPKADDSEVRFDRSLSPAAKLTPAQVNKKERRREQNRRAARKSREKKRQETSLQSEEYRRIEVENGELRRRIAGLKGEVATLDERVQNHLKCCLLRVVTLSE